MRALQARGFSLIELMVALAIGMLIALAVSTLYLHNRASFRLLSIENRMQEDGRFATDWMGRFLRSAGYRPLSVLQNSNTDSAAKAFPTGGGFSTAGAVVVGTQGASGLDTITFRFRGDASGAVTDCSGNAVTSTSVTAFRLQVSGGGLECVQLDSSGNAVSTTKVDGVSGVQSLIFSYGEDTDDPNNINSDRSPNRYLAAGSVGNWANVRAVQVCMVLQSTEDNALESAQAYLDCSRTMVTAADKHLYRAFGTTIYLRNGSR